MRDEKLICTVHQPHGSEERYIVETQVEEATLKSQAERQNQLAKTGKVSTLWAAPPRFWQRKLARALLVGAVAGAGVSLALVAIV